MVDKVQSQKNYAELEKDRALLLPLNHLNSTSEFKKACEKRLTQIRECVSKIRHNLGG